MSPGNLLEIIPADLLDTLVYYKCAYWNFYGRQWVWVRLHSRLLLHKAISVSFSKQLKLVWFSRYRFVPTASISSMKTIDGACSSATLNNSLTSFGPSP